MSIVKRFLAKSNPSLGSVVLSGQEAKLSLNFLNLSDTNTKQVDFDALERRHGHNVDLNVDQTVLEVARRVVTVVDDNVEGLIRCGTEECTRYKELTVKGVRCDGTNLVEGNGATIDNVEDLVVECVTHCTVDHVDDNASVDELVKRLLCIGRVDTSPASPDEHRTVGDTCIGVCFAVARKLAKSVETVGVGDILLCGCDFHLYTTCTGQAVLGSSGWKTETSNFVAVATHGQTSKEWSWWDVDSDIVEDVWCIVSQESLSRTILL